MYFSITNFYLCDLNWVLPNIIIHFHQTSFIVQQTNFEWQCTLSLQLLVVNKLNFEWISLRAFIFYLVVGVRGCFFLSFHTRIRWLSAFCVKQYVRIKSQRNQKQHNYNRTGWQPRSAMAWWFAIPMIAMMFQDKQK